MKIKLLKIPGIVIMLFLVSNYVFAAVSLPHIIGNNMVIQSGKPVAIWGWASAGEKVTVRFESQVKMTAADNYGYWKVILDPLKASGKPVEMTISGTNTIKITNILVGEVWICSGQSNMEFPLAKGAGWRTGVNDWEQEVADAKFPGIRLFLVKIRKADTPQTDCEGEWMVCNPENVKAFSAVGYYFGRQLYKQIQKPVGLIQTAVGGTQAELWTKMSVMEHNSLYDAVFGEYQKNLEKFEDYRIADKAWKDKTTGGKDSSLKIAAPVKVSQPSKPACLWNAMVQPLIPLTFKGVIWYQGESNDTRAVQYKQVFTNLINSWRKEWGLGDFPFYFVQIAAYKDKTPLLRDSQTAVWQSVKNTGMAVTIDVGDSVNIHPLNKSIVGDRLAYWALAKDYGFKNMAFSGPLFKAAKQGGDALILAFDFAGQGLMAKGGELREFEVAGTDKVFYPARAIIKNNNSIIVSSTQVRKPVYARYAWKNFMHPNLYNREGLPAVPFRTDFQAGK